jgi:hypothetical protein
MKFSFSKYVCFNEKYYNNSYHDDTFYKEMSTFNLFDISTRLVSYL